MPSYIAINNSEIDPDSPITADLLTKYRDNPLAVFTDDPSIPSNLKQTTYKLLGTLTTTSGNTQTLSGLDLTRYNSIFALFKEVSAGATGGSLRLGSTGGAAISAALGSSANGFTGYFQTELSTGVAYSYISEKPSLSNLVAVTSMYAGIQGTITTTSTSISFAISSGSFDGGSIVIYGIK